MEGLSNTEIRVLHDALDEEYHAFGRHGPLMYRVSQQLINTTGAHHE